jgi:hypothetical protein
MRTTIDLPEDLHQIATSLARDTGRSFSHTVELLVRRGLEQRGGVAEVAAPYRVDRNTGLPVVRSPRPITSDDVRALEDEP